jgi:hypothetical protein
MSVLTEPEIHYVDACRNEVTFDHHMLKVCLELMRWPQAADQIRAHWQRADPDRIVDTEPLTVLRKMWEGFLVIPQTSPPIGDTIWFITGRGQSILNGRAQWFRDYYDREDPAKTAVLRLGAP